MGYLVISGPEYSCWLLLLLLLLLLVHGLQ
jgi:hypothetical protein